MADPIKRIELKDGTVRYRFVIDVGRDPETRKRKQVTHTFDTKREAKSEYARIKSEVDRGTYVRPSDVTLNTFLDQYLASATRDVEQATASNYRHALRPVRERLGDRRLQALAEGTSRSSSTGCSAPAAGAAGRREAAYRCGRSHSLSAASGPR
ncbi:Arm DNA-binding domain-containing protein [Herbidospora sp. NBRC 101105]|uniref:Arm DNA-binding domain-containing protein n=1 Tax=Herbidospora sp. NBRC 101105 TaxID=3032195 RepID=UPI0024A276F7|nr:Arm DNA-binding domain-containing protein [Herbidospora sp. NBRC 101105]GLX92928.1 hypothetical protein Hesp01_08780 [Herbidospora sp. NBRC 101105]